MNKYFHVPYPPSVNSMYFNLPPKNGKQRGRAKSKAYTAWLGDAGYILNQQYIAPRKGRVRITYMVNRPDKVIRDLSNLVKPLEDLLVRHGLIEDDSLVDEFTMRWDGHGELVFINIESVGHET